MKKTTRKKSQIPAANSSPDQLTFGRIVRQWNEGGTTFSFFGEAMDKVAYSTRRPHIFLFNALKSAHDQINDGKGLVELAGHFDDYGVCFSEYPTEKDIAIFMAGDQYSPDLGQARINTKSGRIWKGIDNNARGRGSDVVVFWCSERDVTRTQLEILKRVFKLDRIVYCAVDSTFFHEPAHATYTKL